MDQLLIDFPDLCKEMLHGDDQLELKIKKKNCVCFIICVRPSELDKQLWVFPGNFFFNFLDKCHGWTLCAIIKERVAYEQ